MICLLLVFSLSGCTREPGLKFPANSKLVVLLEGRPQSLDPDVATDSIGQKLINLVHSSLVRVDSNLNVAPDLAGKVEAKGIGEYIFTLDQKRRFQDGSPVGSADAKASIERVIGSRESRFSAAFDGVQELKILDDHTLRLKLKQVSPYFLWDLSICKIRKGGNGEPAGDFRITKSNRNELHLKRVFETDRKAPSEIIFRFVSDDTSIYQLFFRGDANAMLSALGYTKLQYLEKQGNNALGEKISIETWPGVAYQYLGFNFRNPQLAKKSVRQAIAHAIDRASILKYRIGNLAYLSTGILTSVHSEYEANVKRYDYDIEKSKKLLRAEGVDNLDLELKTGTDKTTRDIARFMALDLAKVGIRLRVQPTEMGSFFSALKKGQFDLMLSRWVGVANASIYHKAFHSSNIGKGANRGAYRNAEMDRLSGAIIKEGSEIRRLKLASEMQKLAAEDLPYISLWHWNQTLITSPPLSISEPKKFQYPNGEYVVFSALRGKDSAK